MDSLFTLLLGWVRSAVSAIWTLVRSGGDSGLLSFLGKNWLIILAVIVAIGLFGDWFMWMVRWQPYRVWGTRMRKIARVFGINRKPDTQKQPVNQYEDYSGDASYEEPLQQENTDWTQSIDFAQEEPMQEEIYPIQLSQAQEEQAFMRASGVDDAELGEYPGKRYDTQAYMRPEAEEDIAYDQGDTYAEPAYDESDTYAEPAYDAGDTYVEPAYDGGDTYVEPAYDAGDTYVEPAYDEGYAPEMQSGLAYGDQSTFMQADNSDAAPPLQPMEYTVEPLEEDVEYSSELTEFDPLASYDDPSALARFMRPQSENYQAQEPMVEEPVAQEIEMSYEPDEIETYAQGEVIDAPEQELAADEYDAEEQSTGRRRRRRTRSDVQADRASGNAPDNLYVMPVRDTLKATEPLPDAPQWPTWNATPQETNLAQGTKKSSLIDRLATRVRDGADINKPRSRIAQIVDPIEEETVRSLPPRVDKGDAFQSPVKPYGFPAYTHEDTDETK